MFSYKVNLENKKDKLLQKNIINGSILSGKIYPLIYDNESLRSKNFYKKIIANRIIYDLLSFEDKLVIGVGVRDLYIASSLDLLDNEMEKILLDLTEIIEPNLIKYKDLLLSSNPSKNYKIVKYISKDDIELDDSLSIYFAETELEDIIVFANPHELSYHNFENILPLDNFFRDLNFELKDPEKVTKDLYRFRLSTSNNSTEQLFDLDKRNYYVKPLNSDSRGGKRMIFNSYDLSNALTKAVNASGLILKDFQFVNNVFRLNKFHPEDNSFLSHYDTPFYDPNRHLASVYTMIIYLTGGSGNPALEIDDYKFYSIKPCTCIIFNQKYEHEAQPYIENEKIFIRTELIFRVNKDIHYSSDASEMFSKSIYMTKQSLYNPELSKYTDDCYNQTSKIHFNICNEKLDKSIWIEKRIDYSKCYLTFATDGYNYLYPKLLDLKECAVLTVIDYFNAKIVGDIFKIESNILSNKINTMDDIQTYLNSKDHVRGFKYDIIEEYKKYYMGFLTRTRKPKTDISPDKVKVIFTPSKQKSLGEYIYNGRLSDYNDTFGKKEIKNYKLEVEYLSQDFYKYFDYYNGCCAIHCPDFLNPKENDYTRDLCEMTDRHICNLLDNNVISVLDEDLYITKENILIDGNKIYFKFKNTFPKINFAACETLGLEPDLITIGITNEILLPPITYYETDNGFHLIIDFFKNNFVIKNSESYIDYADINDYPFDDAIDPESFEYNIPEEFNDNITGRNIIDKFKKYLNDNNYEMIKYLIDKRLITKDLLNDYLDANIEQYSSEWGITYTLWEIILSDSQSDINKIIKDLLSINKNQIHKSIEELLLLILQYNHINSLFYRDTLTFLKNINFKTTNDKIKKLNYECKCRNTRYCYCVDGQRKRIVDIVL